MTIIWHVEVNETQPRIWAERGEKDKVSIPHSTTLANWRISRSVSQRHWNLEISSLFPTSQPWLCILLVQEKERCMVWGSFNTLIHEIFKKGWEGKKYVKILGYRKSSKWGCRLCCSQCTWALSYLQAAATLFLGKCLLSTDITPSIYWY